MPIERKLAAIMFTDIAGYTALSAKDSTKASELLTTQRDTLKPIVEKHGGSWMKEMGDGLLLTFDSATSAVECSIAIQEATKDIEDLNFRIGIHEGEVIKQDGDVIGDDVNIASRIEPFSAVGGVAISDKIYRAISSNTEFETKYIGKPKLKGVAQEVKVYCITSHGLPETDISKVSAKLEEESKFNIFALTGGILTAIGVAFWIAIGVFDVSFGGKIEVPSVGILMMENLGFEDEEFWARGITEDLIIKVAGAGLIRVSPMKEILEVDIKESFEAIAKKLRVKYLLTSSIYKKEDGFDLYCQLIEANSGNSKYANKWSNSFDKAPTIVGNLAENILKSLKVSTKQEITKVPTTNTEAYEYYLKGKYKYNNENLWNNENLEITRELLLKAIELDDNLLKAKILLGRTYIVEQNATTETLTEFRNKARNIFEQVLNQAQKLDNKLMIAYALKYIGNTYTDADAKLDYYMRSLEIAEQLGDKELESKAVYNIGNIYAGKQNFEKALDYLTRSVKLDEELDDKQGIAWALSNIGNLYHHGKNDNDMALDYWLKSLKILEEIGDKSHIVGGRLGNIGAIYNIMGDYEKTIAYTKRSYKIFEELDARIYMVQSLSNMADTYKNQGKYQTALENYNSELEIWEELDNKNEIGITLIEIGEAYNTMGDYETTIGYYNRALEILKNIDNRNLHDINEILGELFINKKEYKTSIIYLEKANDLGGDCLYTKTHLSLSYVAIGQEYDENEIRSLIKKSENIEYTINLRLYELLEDKSYLETAYNQVQEKADVMEDKLKAKFLSYPIPKAIVEEWEKVK